MKSGKYYRSAEGTNPFFDSMLRACEKNGIPYKLIEEPDYGTDKQRNKGAIKGDVLFWLIIIQRKIERIIHKSAKLFDNEQRVAKILNIFTLGKLIYPRYISISGNLQTRGFYYVCIITNKEHKTYDYKDKT